MQMVFDIAITDLDSGESLTVRVDLLVVGSKAVTQIKVPRDLTQEEQEAVEAGIAAVLSSEGIGPMASASVQCANSAEVQIVTRRFLGGGQG